MDPLMSLMTPERLADPYTGYEMLRRISPVFHAPGVFGLGAWLVTSHAVCSSTLRSKAFGKEGERVLPPEILAQIPQETMELSERRRQNMLFRDPPAHTRLRSLVSQAFTPRAIERLRPQIAATTERLLDECEGSFDLIARLAFPLPIIVISELLGVPHADKDRFKAWSTDLTKGLNPGATDEDLDAVGRAIEGLDAYMTDVIEERRRAPRNDLISEMVAAHEAGDRLSMDELLATTRLLLTAGHETTVNLIGNGTLALLRNPSQWARLDGSCEEFLRYDSPVQMTMRFAMEDAPLGAQTATRGDLCILLLGAGNRDPEVFADPNALDVRRDNADKHLSFGAGIHYCLGAPLARLEGEIAFAALHRRFPALQLDGELEYRRSPVLRGLKALPVRG